MPGWDDMRYALAIARSGGLAGAAAALGVNPSTVFRRLKRLEDALGARLFERLPGGYRPTAAGEQVVGAAERMEQEAIAADRLVSGRDHRLSGTLRVTASETLAYRLLTPHLAAFRERHPGIRVELIVDNRLLRLSKREADIALRATRPAEGDLFGRKLAEVAWTLYGSLAYLERHGAPREPAELGRHALIGWEEGTIRIKAAEWLRAVAPESTVVYRVNSLLNQLVAARAGLGLAVLPCFLADPEPGLRRALPPVDALARELWMVTHADLSRTARIRAFMDIVGTALIRERALFEGRAVPADGDEPVRTVPAAASLAG